MIASTLWVKYPAAMTRVDYQFSHSNYLTHVFPRLISGWLRLRQDERDYLTRHESTRWEEWKAENPSWVDLNVWA